MSKSKKILLLTAFVFSMFFGVQGTASAMHIMEGFLSPTWCISWGVLCIPFLLIGVLSIKKKVAVSRKSLVLLALCGAFVFVLSALKIPSVTGSCSHPTGIGLGAILFGPFVMSVIGVIVLLFQAVLLAHGGLTTLGANTFSMAIVGSIVAFVTYKLCKKLRVNTGVAVFLAAFLGDLLTYVTTSLQLALAYPVNGSIAASMLKFSSIFALTQIPLAVVEGLVTVVVFNIIQQYNSEQLEQLVLLKS